MDDRSFASEAPVTVNVSPFGVFLSLSQDLHRIPSLIFPQLLMSVAVTPPSFGFCYASSNVLCTVNSETKNNTLRLYSARAWLRAENITLKQCVILRFQTKNNSCSTSSSGSNIRSSGLCAVEISQRNIRVVCRIQEDNSSNSTVTKFKLFFFT